MSAVEAGPLTCPECSRPHGSHERFCSACGMPLVHAHQGEEAARSDAHGRARKIDPRFVEGELVRVAGGRHQAEAELIQGMLLEEGVPSLLRRSPGFDVPDFLAGGPRDVFVPMSGAEAAREVLLDANMAPQERSAPARSDASQAARLAGAILAGGGLTAAVTWVLLELSPG